MKAVQPTTTVAVMALLGKAVEKSGLLQKLADDYYFASTERERWIAIAKLTATGLAAGLISTVVAGLVYSVVMEKLYDNDNWVTGPFALI